jgi:hypothetical protein
MPQLGKFAISALALVVFAAAAQAQTYLCIADMGTGSPIVRRHEPGRPPDLTLKTNDTW